MANTIKFGNGQWATKEDSILAYNDENANFKPLPFVTSRASTATTVNKSGLLETVASGVPRVDYLDNSKGSYLLEPSSTNLITQSESFGNTYWTKSGATIEGDASTAGSELVNNSNWVVSNVTESLGVITFTDDGADSYALLENTLTVGLMYKISYTIDSYSNGALSINEIFNVPTSVGNHTIYSTATNQRVILDDIGETSLVISNVSVKEVQGFSAPSVDSPLGAFKLVEDSSNGVHRIYSGNISVINSQVYSAFIYAKKGERNFIQLLFGSTGFGNVHCNFDLNTGEIGTPSGCSAKIEVLSNGFYKCSITATSNLTTNSSTLIALPVTSLTSARQESYTGDGTSGVYIFGAQVEQKSYATSYIPTAGTTISRTADTASKSGISSLINSEEGTLFAEIAALADDQTNRIISLSNGANENIISVQFSNAQSNDIIAYYNATGQTGRAISTSSYNIKSFNKTALVWNNSSFKFYVNGYLIGSSTIETPLVDGTLNQLKFQYGNGTLPFYGNCKDLRVYKTALSDAELISLTTI